MINKLKDELCNRDCSIIALFRNSYYISYASGIKPVLLPIRRNKEYFKDSIVVDKAIGKAVAMLLIRSKVKMVHALLMSKEAVKLFEEYHIPYSYDKLTDYIMNNNGDDLCPMEKTVLNTTDLEEAYILLDNKLNNIYNS